MVRSCLTTDDQSRVLRWLAVEIKSALQLPETVDELLANPCLLHSYLVKTTVNWNSISKEVGVEEKKVSRWYYETHLRHILTIKMTNEDRGEIRKIIIDWIRCRQIPDERLYQVIHGRFGEKYSRQELRMTYYNMLNSRSIRSVLSECDIQRPTRRRKTPEAEHSSLSSSTVHHIPGYSPNSHPSAVEAKRPPPAGFQKISTIAPASSETNIVAKGEAAGNMLSESFTFNPLVIQSTAQQNQQGKLPVLQAIPITIDLNNQLAYIPMIIVDPGTSVWSLAPNNNQAGSANQ